MHCANWKRIRKRKKKKRLHILYRTPLIGHSGKGRSARGGRQHRIRLDGGTVRCGAVGVVHDSVHLSKPIEVSNTRGNETVTQFFFFKSTRGSQVRTQTTGKDGHHSTRE